MAVTKCKNGHFYDDEKFDKCPHCENPLPQRRVLSDELTQYTPVFTSSNSGAIKIDMGNVGSDEKTVGIFKTDSGNDPVVGWLVCIKGTEWGRSYQLHSGRNYIGRAVTSDIAITDDEQVSAKDHCSIVFEPRRSMFLLARGKGEIVLLNGVPLQESSALFGDETIEIGMSAFVFVPYCKEGRTWQEN